MVHKVRLYPGYVNDGIALSCTKQKNSPMPNLRILVADDHELVRKGIRSLLEAEADWKVISEVDDGKKAVQEAQKLKPDIAILDVSMPGLTGLEAAARIRKALPDTKLLI